MATVASNHVGEPSRSNDNDQLTESRPSFTAVNGSASPASVAKSKSEQEPQKETPESSGHRTNVQSHPKEVPSAAPSNQDVQINGHEPAGQGSRPSPAPIANQSQDPASAHVSKPPTPAPPPTQTQAVDPSASTQPPQHPEGPPEQRRQSQHYSNGHSRNSSTQPANVAVMNQHAAKRKRSTDGEHERRPDYENQGHPTYPMNGAPQSPGPRRHELENGHPRDMQGYSPRQTYPPPPPSFGPSPHDPYAGPPRMRDSTQEIYPRPERHQLVRNDYDQPVDPSIAPQAPRPYYTDPDDAHMATVLQRETRGYESMPRDTYGSPEDDDDPNGHYDYGTNRSSQDLDRKRRKRVFSNRTKTGCMTCRRRKKKCDEQHPECKLATVLLPYSNLFLLCQVLIIGRQ